MNRLLRALILSAMVAAMAALGFSAVWAGRQTPPGAALLVNRMNGAYRALESYRDTANITRKAGGKETHGTLILAMQKPDKMRVELKGDYLNTTIVDDGKTVIALRPDRKDYTKTDAPRQIIGSDVIGKIDMPSVGARLISRLLAGLGRTGELGDKLVAASITGPELIAGKQTYTLTFPYQSGGEAQVLVTATDYLIRRVKIVKGSDVLWDETHDVVIGKPLPATDFALTLPEGARIVSDLPPLEQPQETAAAPAGGQSSAPANEPPVSKGAALAVYNANGCGGCHNAGAPNLSREGAKPGRTAAWISEQIRDPRSHNPASSMPSFAGRIADRDIQTLAAYLATLK